METKDKLTYQDARLSLGNINKIYSEIVNCRVVKPPYSDQLRPTSFWLSKRYGFRPFLDFKCPAWEGGEITDMIVIDGSEYYMWVDKKKNIMKIFKENGCCPRQIGKDQCVRTDGFFKFTKMNFVKGKPRNFYDDVPSLYESSTGIQINKVVDGAPVDGEFGDTTFASSYEAPGGGLLGGHEYRWGGENGIEAGDYIFTFGLRKSFEPGVSGIPGQVGVVTRKIGLYNIDVLSAWAGFQLGQEEGKDLKYRIFPDWGEVFMIDTCDGMKLWTYDMDGVDDDFIQTGMTNESSSFITTNNGDQIIYYNESGYVNYGGSGTLKFYRTSNQSFEAPPGLKSMVNFQQYTLLFTDDTLSVVNFGINEETGELLYSLQPTDLNIGLWSRDAFDLYRSSFYFVGSDKRLYALTINPTNYGTYHVELEDMSSYVKGELDLLDKNDIVNLQAKNQDLKIFINGDFRDNTYSHKTKILIYEKDYQFRHKWVSCVCVITGEYRGKYIGDNLYNYCGYEDDYNYAAGEGIKYQQKLSLYLGENELDDANLNMWQNKIVRQLTFLVGWNSYLTNGNFEFRLDTYTNCVKPTLILNKPEDRCYINLLNSIKNGDIIEPTEDMKQLISDCSNYAHDCDGSTDVLGELTADERCGCPDIQANYDNYCVCINDKKYYVTPMSKVKIWGVENVSASMYKFTFSAYGDNVLEFGGCIIPYMRNNPEEDEQFCTNEMLCTDCKEECICGKSEENKVECIC